MTDDINMGVVLAALLIVVGIAGGILRLRHPGPCWWTPPVLLLYIVASVLVLQGLSGDL